MEQWLWNNSGYTYPELSLNTVYQFRVKTRNIDGLENDWVGPQARATRIEEVSGADFDISVSSIGFKAGNVGTMTNLSGGDSAVWYGCYSNSGYTGLVASTWTKNTDYWYVTTLSTNTEYYWKANSRN